MKKTVLVTGACVNTGVAIVEKFASEGFDVVFTGRNEDKVRIAEADYRKAFPESVIHGFALNSLTPEGKADAQAVRDFFALLDSRGIFAQALVLNAADQGLGIELNEEECLKHPYQVHTLRHYTGALTDIRPAKTEFFY